MVPEFNLKDYGYAFGVSATKGSLVGKAKLFSRFLSFYSSMDFSIIPGLLWFRKLDSQILATRALGTTCSKLQSRVISAPIAILLTIGWILDLFCFWKLFRLDWEQNIADVLFTVGFMEIEPLTKALELCCLKWPVYILKDYFFIWLRNSILFLINHEAKHNLGCKIY